MPQAMTRLSVTHLFERKSKSLIPLLEDRDTVLVPSMITSTTWLVPMKTLLVMLSLVFVQQAEVPT